MSVYTRTGDDGTTGLLGGVRVVKTDERIEALGALDELNASIGICVSMLSSTDMSDIKAELTTIQHILFSIGSRCAAPSRARLAAHARTTGFPAPHIPSQPTKADVVILEKAIDRYDRHIAPLSGFILPGGSPSAAYLHSARSVCRRAERRLGKVTLDHIIMKYINRLSDYLFTCARVVNARMHAQDILWTK